MKLWFTKPKAEYIAPTGTKWYYEIIVSEKSWLIRFIPKDPLSTELRQELLGKSTTKEVATSDAITAAQTKLKELEA